MPGRVNTKFVFLLTSTLVLLVLALAGFYFLVVRQSAEELIQDGDRYVEDGDLKQAVRTFAKAYHKDPENLDLINKYIHVLNTIKADDKIEARQYLGYLLELHRVASEVNPSDLEPLDDYYRLYTNLARDFGGLNWWNNLYQITTRKLDRYPTNPIALKYHGMAQVRRLSPDLPRQDQTRAKEQLEATLARDPDDHDAAHHLALWDLFESRRLMATAGRAEDVTKFRNSALELSNDMLAKDPDELVRQIRHLAITLNLLNSLRTEEDAELIEALRKQAEPILTQAEARLLENPRPPWAVLAITNAIYRLDQMAEPGNEAAGSTSGLRRALSLLQTAADADPRDIGFRVRMGGILAYMGRDEEALDVLQQVREMGGKRTAFEAIRAQTLQFLAACQAGDLVLKKLKKDLTPEQAQAVYTEVQEIIDQIKRQHGQRPETSMLAGKLDMAQGRYGQAMIAFDKASSQYGDANVEALLYSARARKRTRQTGAAASRLELLAEGMDSPPTELRIELAKLYIDMTMHPAAEVQIKLVLKAEPNNAQALGIKGLLLSRRDEIEPAIALYERIDPITEPWIVPALASLYLKNNQENKAKDLLQQRYEQAPDHESVLKLLFRITENPGQRQQLIDRSREAGASDPLLTVLQAQVNSQEQPDVEELAEHLIDKMDNPLQKALARFDWAREKGDVDGSKTALAQAVAIDPDHKGVINRQFEVAVFRGQWDKASQLAAQAGAQNHDLAGGAFFRGRLAAARAARGDKKQRATAVAEYRSGLTLCPVFSDGWRQLGDLLRLDRNLEQAIEAYRRAVDQSPKNERAWRAMATVEDQRGNHTLALGHLATARKYNPNNMAMAMQYMAYEEKYGRTERALELRLEIAAEQPDYTDNRRALALLLGRVDQRDEAMAVIEALTAEEGETAANVGTLASLHAAFNEVETGLAVIERYIESRGEAASADDLVLLGRYHLATNNIELMLASYNRARAKESPDTRPVTRELADLLFARHAFKQAAQFYRDLYDEKPNDQFLGHRLAEVLFRVGQTEQAGELLAALDTTAPGLVLQGLIAHKANDRAKALRLMDEAIRKDKGYSMARFQRARLLALDPDQITTASDDLEEALHLNPNLHSARRLLAELLVRRSEAPEAMRELRTLLELQPRDINTRRRLNQLYLNAGDTSSARILLNKGTELFPDQAIWPRLQAELAAHEQDRNAAIRHWRRAVELALDPSVLANTLINLSMLLIQSERPREALDALDEHPDLVGQVPMLQAMRGWALLHEGESDQGLKVLAKAAGQSSSLTDLAAVTRFMGLALGPEEAIAQLSKMRNLKNTLWREVVVAELELAAIKFNAAADRLLRIDPDLLANDTQTRLVLDRLLATSLHEAGRYAEARKPYEQIIQQTPNDVATLNNFAYLLADKLNEPEAALKLADRAAALSPSNARILDTLGWIQYKLGQVNQARDTLQGSFTAKALAANCYHLGVVSAEMDEYGRARRYLEQAIDMAEKSDDEDHVLEEAKKLLDSLGT